MATAIMERIKVAFEAADLTAIGDLLDPDVRWGASGEPVPSCQNRRQVLAWYQRGRNAGVRARVTELVAHGNKILVALKVVGNLAAEEQGGEVDRWQVLTVADGRIVEIRGFDERSAAASRARSPESDRYRGPEPRGTHAARRQERRRPERTRHRLGPWRYLLEISPPGPSRRCGRNSRAASRRGRSSGRPRCRS